MMEDDLTDDNTIKIDFDSDLDPNLGSWNSDGTITINLDETYGATTSYWSGDSINITTTSDPYTSPFSNRFKSIDLDILEKYPTAKNLYEDFISVYNICEAEEELNGDDEDDIPF